MLRLKYFLLVISVCIAVFICCNSPFKKQTTSSNAYRNLHDSVQYVGMEKCRSCHSNIHSTFIHTGMGESWDHAKREKSSGKFDEHAYVYDKYKDFWYHPFWLNDSLYIREFRLEGTDTVYSRTEKISYIVGSGQHTNSHVWMENGYLYQAPLTFYTQQGIWNLPPGFEEGENSRWSRTISLECMNCHNMYPALPHIKVHEQESDEAFASHAEWSNDSENKFLSVKTGIECERCHGPGSIHVREKMAGIVVDTSKEIDYSIVNPKNLSRDLQVELCQRCHLQGISVLKEGKTFFDFKPGMMLNEVEDVFMPRYENDPPKFIMASHADRMKQSACYKNSEMTCLTCHNPHISVKITPPDGFNNACRSCHSSAHSNDCTLPLERRVAEMNNCYKCHMQESETIDIPHVTVHDHRIQKPVSRDQQNAILKFVKLECMTTKDPSPLLMAQGYLQTYEAFSAQPFLLDSAASYLNKASRNDREVLTAKVRLSFLRKNYEEVVRLSADVKPESERDAWMLYRIGESFFQKADYANAEKFYTAAARLSSNNLEFLNKQASALMATGRLDEAQIIFRHCVSENSKFASAISNLGYTYFLKGDIAYANALFDRALALDPDYEQGLMNKAALLLSQQKIEEAKKILNRVLKINPDNPKATQALQQLNTM